MSINLFQESLKSEKSAKSISLKKLCRYVDKVNSDYSIVDMKVLFDEIIKLDKEDQIIFNSRFVMNKTLKSICDELHLSKYKVSKSLNDSLKKLSFNNDIFK